MSDPKFDKMDQEMMKSMKPLRDKKISDGMLKGFSASVERRLELQNQPAIRRAFAPVWVPVLAVMILASVVVLRLPQTPTALPPVLKTVDYAELNENERELDVDDEIAALKELGIWDDNDDSLLGADEVDAQELELSSNDIVETNIA